jgi:uncharacterized protein (DUF1015 family)
LVDIRPFRALTYTPKAGNPADLITQPYDKIDTAQQRAYYALSPYNFCRLILPLEENKYEVAQQRVSQWLEEQVLSKEEQPAIFVSRQKFHLEGKQYSRIGIIAALRLYPYSENMVYPHEATYKAPKADRLNMLRNVQKDLEPVFLMYQDPQAQTIEFMDEVTKTEPIVEVGDALGVEHTIWKVADPQKIQHLQSIFEQKSMVINDGHHRYESAIAYRDEMRAKGSWTEEDAFNFYMCYMVPVQEEGLIVLPTHRLLKSYKLTAEVLEGFSCFFGIEQIEPTLRAIEAFLCSHVGEHAFCVYDGKKACGLTLKHDSNVYEFIEAYVSRETKVFDVVILRDIVFRQVLKTGQLDLDDTILYERWTKDALARVDSGEASIAFLVNPIPAKTVAEIALQHELLPEKSTDFYPKLVSGLVLMDISVGEKL